MEVMVPLALAGGLVGLCVVTTMKGRSRIVRAVALCIPVLALIIMAGLFDMVSGGTPLGLKAAGVLVGGFVLLAPLVGALMPARASSRWARRNERLTS